MTEVTVNNHGDHWVSPYMTSKKNKSPKLVSCPSYSAIVSDEAARRQQVSSGLMPQIPFHRQVVNIEDFVELMLVGWWFKT